MNRQKKFIDKYAAGDIPWDSPEPPPEIIELAAELPAGKALDLGCGYGRTAIFLAARGWQVDAVDYIPRAITEARQRAEKARFAGQINFFQADVTSLAFLSAGYDLAVDIGCCHRMPEAELRAFHSQIKRLLKPGALFLLFAHLNDPARGHYEWLDEDILHGFFQDGFHIEKVIYGTTQVRDREPWRSAWFWFRKD